MNRREQPAVLQAENAPMPSGNAEQASIAYQELEGPLNQPFNSTPTPEQVQNALYLIRAQAALLSCWGPEGTQEAINVAVDKTDVAVHTSFRLWQVFEYVLLNGLDKQGWKGDQERTDSAFNKHIVGHAEIAALSLVIPVVIAIGIHCHEKQIRRTRQTIAHQIRGIQAINQDASITEEDYLQTLQNLLDRDKIALPPEGKVKESELQKEAKPASPSWIRKALSATWDFLAQSALIFWPTWMTAVFIVGFAASYAFPVLPVVVAVSFGIAALITGGLAYLRRRKEKRLANLLPKAEQKDAEERKKAAEEIRKKAEHSLKIILAMMPRLLQRGHMKLAHRRFKEVTRNTYNALFPKEPIRPAAPQAQSPYEVHTIQTDRPVRGEGREQERLLVLINRNLDEQAKPITPPPQKNMQQYVENSTLGQRLLGSRGARRKFLAAFITDTVIAQYTLSAFVFWILGAAVLSIGLLTGLAPALAGLAAACSVGGMFLLGGIFPGVTAALNVLIGVGFTNHYLQAVKAKRVQLIQTIYQQLKAPYQPNNQRWIEEIRAARKAQDDPLATIQSDGVTQEEAFNFFHKRVEEQKKAIAVTLKERQRALKAKLKRGDALSDEENLILNFDPKKIDVFNDRYFKTQEQAPSGARRISHFLYQLYKGINGAQTGIFVSRSLFLMGAALAFACVAAGPFAPVVFVAIAATIGAIALTAKLFRLYLERKEKNRQFFAETLPDRISYLKKNYKQLVVVRGLLSPAYIGEQRHNMRQHLVAARNTVRMAEEAQKAATITRVAHTYVTNAMTAGVAQFGVFAEQRRQQNAAAANTDTAEAHHTASIA